MAGQDISLLFGVLGGGSISGESGTLIKSQLDKIVSSLNNASGSKQCRIKLNLDMAGTKSAFSSGIKQITESLSGQKQFKIKVSKIDATSAINDFKARLEAMLKTVKVSTGFSVKLGANGATSAIKEISGDAKGAVLSLAEVEARLREINATNQGITRGYKTVRGMLGAETTGDTPQSVEALRQKYIELQTAVSNLQAKKRQATQEEVSQIYTLQTEMQKLLVSTNERIRSVNAAAQASKRAADAERTAADAQIAKEAERKRLLDQLSALQTKAAAALRYTNAGNTQQYQQIKEAKAALDAMAQGYRALDSTSLDRLGAVITENTTKIRAMGMASRSLGDTMLANAKKFTSWFGISQIIMRLVGMIRKMVTAVKDIDTAMTELRKVTSETEVAYTQFLDKATVRAKTLGATVTDTVNATADFARLGYTLEASSRLADSALVYKNVGDGIESIGNASESVISTMQAFGIEAENSILIVDKFNEVGNNFAISAKGVGDALIRSASALASANNSLDESIALITAANSVVQDADKVGKQNCPTTQ